MAKLTTNERNSLDKSEFVYPGQRKFPINDRAHAANAMARAAQSDVPSIKANVSAAVHRKFPNMGKE